MTASNLSSAARDEPSDFRRLIQLCFPLMLSLCATNLVGFFDRVFLANYSIKALEGYVIGFVLAILFQSSFMRLTTLGQSFVSFYNGGNEQRRIGESVWQMIWFSFLSMLVALPIGYILIPVVFGGSPVQETATSYFTYVLWGNFLFPLQAALSSFFIGQNRAKVVFITIFAAQCLHVLLDYLLIFGVENYIPALGVEATAIALLANRAVVCIVLFSLFLSKRQRITYGTDCFSFNWKVFYSQVRAGIPLSMAPLIGMSGWVVVSRLMAMKGGDYLMIFSVGSTLTVCFAFMNDALFQAVMTLVSNLLGKGHFSAIKRLIAQAFVLLSLMMLVLAIPFLIYPHMLLSFLFSPLPAEATMSILFSACYSSWLYILCEGISFIGMGLLAATRQTLFFIFTSSLIWIIGYVPVTTTMNAWHWRAETFWLIISANALTVGALYFLKAKQLITLRKQELLG